MIRLLTARLAPPATAPAPARGDRVPAALAPEPPRRTPRARLRDWAELLRVSALFTVPGDALAGAAAAGLRPNRGTAYAVGASLCLYEAGMALNDWSDREEDGIDRPHRPIPSGRITPRAALTAAGVLTVTGLALAARAGRPALAVATALSATVWAYDLRLKHTPAAPAAMAAARGLDLLLGTTATLSAARHPVAPAPGTSSRASRRAAAVSEGGAFGPAPAPDASSRRSPRATAVSRPGAPASASAPRGAVTASRSAVSAPALATGGAAAAGRSAGSVPAPAAASAPGAPASASRRAAAVGVRGARPLWSRQG
ncbi:UbiA family prenyltransferase, partial [Streptomyces sp. NPDC002996]